jgi:hypothetical protein
VLTPRQPITASPYSITAGTVTGPIDGSLIKPGTITSTQLAATAGGLPSGGLVLSATQNPALANAGYVKIGTTTIAESWQPQSNGTAPSGRISHTAVWTGTEMIVWGGYNSGYLGDGGRFNPTSNSWTAVTATGAPSARESHTAVWTGHRDDRLGWIQRRPVE